MIFHYLFFVLHRAYPTCKPLKKADEKQQIFEDSVKVLLGRASHEAGGACEEKTTEDVPSEKNTTNDRLGSKIALVCTT